MLNKTPNLEKDGQTKLCPLKSSNSFLFVHTLHMTSPWPTAQGTLVPCRCTCKTLLSGWSIANNPLFLSDFKWSSSGCKRRCLGQAIPIRSLLQHVYGYIRLVWIYFFCAEVTLGAVWCTPKSKRAGYTTRVFVPSVGERSTGRARITGTDIGLFGLSTVSELGKYPLAWHGSQLVWFC